MGLTIMAALVGGTVGRQTSCQVTNIYVHTPTTATATLGSNEDMEEKELSREVLRWWGGKGGGHLDQGWLEGISRCIFLFSYK